MTISIDIVCVLMLLASVFQILGCGRNKHQLLKIFDPVVVREFTVASVVGVMSSTAAEVDR